MGAPFEVRRQKPLSGAVHRPAAGGASTRIRYELVDIDRLRPHEGLRKSLLKETIAEIERAGFVRLPVLVEDEHYVILDGHHRVAALRALGCRKVPAYLIDYYDDAVDLMTWPGAIVSSITKGEVVDRGLRGDLFPPKTTRHRVTAKLEEVVVSLEDLR